VGAGLYAGGLRTGAMLQSKLVAMAGAVVKSVGSLAVVKAAGDLAVVEAAGSLAAVKVAGSLALVEEAVKADQTLYRYLYCSCLPRHLAVQVVP